MELKQETDPPLIYAFDPSIKLSDALLIIQLFRLKHIVFEIQPKHP